MERKVTAQQYACGMRHGGHVWRLAERTTLWTGVGLGEGHHENVGVFRCGRCGLAYNTTWTHLTDAEKAIVSESMKG